MEHFLKYGDGQATWHDLDVETWELSDASIDATIALMATARQRAATTLARRHRAVEKRSAQIRHYEERARSFLAEAAMHVVYGMDCCFEVQPQFAL